MAPMRRELLLPLLLLLLLLPGAASGKKCPLNFIKDRNGLFNYYRLGDLHVGGIVPASPTVFKLAVFHEPPRTRLLVRWQFLYWHILSFLLATEEVNRNPQLLSNLTLEYDVYDTCHDVRMTYEATTDLLSIGQANIPNYSCGRRSNLLTVIEGVDSDTSKQISILSRIYKIPQVSYGFVSEGLNDKTQFPFIYRMVPREGHLYQVIAKLLLHFGWNWVGLIAPDTDNGGRFMRTLTPILTRNSICTTFSLMISGLTMETDILPLEIFNMWNNISLLIYYGEIRFFYSTMKRLHDRVVKYNVPTGGKIWITTALSDLQLYLSYEVITSGQIHGFFSFILDQDKQAKNVDFRAFFHDMEQFRKKAFIYPHLKHRLSVKGRIRCKENILETPPEEFVETTLSLDRDSIYNLVQAVARAVDARRSSRS